jgi:hypothetical protein
MNTDVIVPLVLPLAAWPVMRTAARRLPPGFASWLLVGSGLVLAAGSTATLAIQAFGGLTLVPAVANLGHYSPADLRDETDVNVTLAVLSGVALAAILGAGVHTALRYRRWSRALHRELDAHSREAGVIVLPGKEPLAFSVPGRGGRIAISSGMLAALDPRERCALLAHERAHLRCRHHFFLAAVALSTLANPLLRPLGSAARFTLERWADEAAADRVGNRTLVATAVAKAALASRPKTSFAMAATGGPVPRRVSALLAAPSPRRRVLAALLATLVLGAAGWSADAALTTATELHDGIEVAQGDAPGHHPVLGQRAHCKTALAAVSQQRRKCAQR